MTTHNAVTARANGKLGEVILHDARFKAEEALHAKFREPGPDGFYQVGIIAEELPDNSEGHKSLVHFADPYQNLTVDDSGKISGDLGAPLTIVSFPSYASVQEVDDMRSRMIPMPETCEIIRFLAEAKELNAIPNIVAGTAIGKSFGIKRFSYSLFGTGVGPLDFYCNGQTDVSDLHGMWVPKTNEQDRHKWNEFLESMEGKRQLEAILDKPIEEGLSLDQKMAVIHQRLNALAQEVGLSTGTAWEFAPGAIPKAYNAHFDPNQRRIVDFSDSGRGFMLHVQEIGLAAPRVMNALLELGGELGGLNDELQIWRNGGQVVRRGSDTFIVMSTNPEEEAGYKERNELDLALIRRVLTLRMGSQLKPFSLNLASQRYFRYQAGNCPTERPRGCLLELYYYPDEIGKALGSVMAAYHQSYTTDFKKGEGKGKSRYVVPSIDQLGRLADYMLRLQVRDRKTGEPDLVETLKRGVRTIYLSGLSTEEVRNAQIQKLTNLLTSDSLVQPYMGVSRTPAEQLCYAVTDIMRNREQNGSGYSPELAGQMARARHTRIREGSDAMRNDILSKSGVIDTVKSLIGLKKP